MPLARRSERRGRSCRRPATVPPDFVRPSAHTAEAVAQYGDSLLYTTTYYEKSPFDCPTTVEPAGTARRTVYRETRYGVETNPTDGDGRQIFTGPFRWKPVTRLPPKGARPPTSFPLSHNRLSVIWEPRLAGATRLTCSLRTSEGISFLEIMIGIISILALIAIPKFMGTAAPRWSRRGRCREQVYTLQQAPLYGRDLYDPDVIAVCVKPSVGILCSQGSAKTVFPLIDHVSSANSSTRSMRASSTCRPPRTSAQRGGRRRASPSNEKHPQRSDDRHPQRLCAPASRSIVDHGPPSLPLQRPGQHLAFSPAEVAATSSGGIVFAGPTQFLRHDLRNQDLIGAGR